MVVVSGSGMEGELGIGNGNGMDLRKGRCRRKDAEIGGARYID